MPRTPDLSGLPAGKMEIEAREAYVVGDAQRITPLEKQSVADEARESWKKLRKAISGVDDIPPEIEAIPEIYFTVLHNAALWDAFSATSAEMSARGKLSPRDREILMLRVGWLWQAPFEWGEHVAIGKRVGLSSEEIERITEGSGAPGWSEHDAALLRAVEELLTDAMITDDTWAVLAKSLDEAQLFEVPIVVGQFTSVAFFQNALRIPLKSDNPGLSAR